MKQKIDYPRAVLATARRHKRSVSNLFAKSNLLQLLSLVICLGWSSCSEILPELTEKPNQFTETTIQGEYSVELEFIGRDSLRLFYSRGSAEISEDRNVEITISDSVTVEHAKFDRIWGIASSDGIFIGELSSSTASSSYPLEAHDFLPHAPFQRIGSTFLLDSTLGQDSLGFINFKMDKL